MAEVADLRRDAMHCPRCGGRTNVLETRANRRRRRCVTCDFRYSTQEVLESEVERTADFVSRACALIVEGVNDGIIAGR